MEHTIKQIHGQITSCNDCPRLVSWREEIAEKKRKSFLEWDYWGKPVPGYGDPKSGLLILGLAPAAHGGNRTGRVFTGDKSADFLFRCMHAAGLSNQPNSDSMDDGLKFKGYMTVAVKCVPPGDKPLAEEKENCQKFLLREFRLLKNLKIVLGLGKIGFDACVYYFKSYYEFKEKIKFVHGKIYKVPKNILLVGCYHPSPRNVNTGRINENKMTNLFKRILKLVD